MTDDDGPSEPIRFLSVEDVLLLHADTMAHEGGGEGVRDVGLLDAATIMPRQSFGGQYVHQGLAAMAAAYLFHIVRGHPFIDGNKRVGALAALVFLDVNGATKLPRARDLERATMAVAAGELGKSELLQWFVDQCG